MVAMLRLSAGAHRTLFPRVGGEEEWRLIDLVISVIFYVKRPQGRRCAGIRTVTKITKIPIRGKNYPF
ncbi:hypothetical protein BGL48_06330 [Salinivibrio sp. SS3]|nr:hypothetical protein BGL48_06330 [Salinivibrio sp. BNH]OOE56767.1 hypothetical protein BZG10_00395 [Salinivibrio kushneri]OOE62512.1 hypothetical protein BZG18_03225 [Salinivibrio kushneri]